MSPFSLDLHQQVERIVRLNKGCSGEIRVSLVTPFTVPILRTTVHLYFFPPYSVSMVVYLESLRRHDNGRYLGLVSVVSWNIAQVFRLDQRNSSYHPSSSIKLKDLTIRGTDGVSDEVTRVGQSLYERRRVKSLRFSNLTELGLSVRRRGRSVFLVGRWDVSVFLKPESPKVSSLPRSDRT